MKVKINEVIRESSIDLVDFSTEYGNARAYWNGSVPEVDKEYFVELEIESALVWGDNVRKVDYGKISIGIEGETLWIIGYLESVDDDGYTIIRLGGTIISLDVTGEPLPAGLLVKVEAEKVILFKVDY